MATELYMNSRQKYSRPQAVLFSDNPGVFDEETQLYLPIPDGNEMRSNSAPTTQQFLILSDDNRQDIGISNTRIEKRERMVNGRMRSYHIADKLKINLSWNMLPSRSFSKSPEFNTETGNPTITIASNAYNKNIVDASAYSSQYTTDGGAGGVEVLDWYENHTGPFYVFLSYDKYTSFASNQYDQLSAYNEVVEMYFADFSYTIVKRGLHDFWNVSISLEEV